MVFDPLKDKPQFMKEKEQIEESKGSLSPQNEENKLMRSVLESGEQQEIDVGKILTESVSRGLSNFTPDIFFKNLVDNFKNAERIYGKSLIREISGYDPNFIRKNLNQPEFKRELEKKINETSKELKKNKAVKKDGSFHEESVELAALMMLATEIERIKGAGLGPRLKEFGSYGNKSDFRAFRNDPYKQLAVKQTIKTAIRRQHKTITKADFRAHDLETHGRVSMLYALDVSGSMIGEKLSLAKKAGIALAWNGIKERNYVGCLIFDTEIKESLSPQKEILPVATMLAGAKAGKETDLAKAINEGIKLLKIKRGKKHLLLVTDGMPTKGKLPNANAYEAASIAKTQKISVSIIGISLEKEGLKVAEKITELGGGRLYSASSIEEMYGVILEDYYQSIKSF